MDLRDSWLHCPRDGKRLAIDSAEEEGQPRVRHECLDCGYAVMAPGTLPRGTGTPFMAALRQRLWELQP